MRFFRYLKWPLIGLILLSVFLLAAYFLSQRWESQKEDVRTGLLTRPLESEKDALQVRAWISPNKVKAGHSVPFWIWFINVSRGPITNLHFVVFEPTGGFKTPAGHCWVKGIKGLLPGCLEGKRNDKGNLPARLEPGEGVSVSAELEAGERAGLYAPAAVFSWTSDTGGVENRQAISIGPVEIIDTSPPLRILPGDRENYLNAARRLKEIAIPLVLVAIGFLVQRATQRYTQISQVWQSQISQSLSDAQKYSMPVLSPLVRLRKNIGDAVKGQERARQESFFAVMLFLSRMRFMANQIGGFQFRNRQGEAVVSYAWTALREFVEDKLGLDDLQLAERRMTQDEDFHSFTAKFAPKSERPLQRIVGEVLDVLRCSGKDDENQQAREAVGRLRIRFADWLEDSSQPFTNFLPLFNVMSGSMDFEINRIFETWYGKKEKFPKKELRQAEMELDRLPQSPALQTLKYALARYLRWR